MTERRARRRRPVVREPARRVVLEPATAYEALTRQMLEALSDDVREIRERVNGLLFMVAGGILLDLAARLLS